MADALKQTIADLVLDPSRQGLRTVAVGDDIYEVEYRRLDSLNGSFRVTGNPKVGPRYFTLKVSESY